jgi:hypothetical protein
LAPSTGNTPVLDRLQARARQRFVGRQAEIAVFRAALDAGEPPFVVLHIHGPGGVGKTTLLREMAREARERGRYVIRIDGRDVHASPPGFLRALVEALHGDGEVMPPTDVTVPPGSVLLIDTFEKIQPLDAWLRERFLPRLAANCLIVIAGRNQPAPEWRSDIEWAGLARSVALGNLHAHEVAAYLAARGVPPACLDRVQAFTHGHPLALSLVADVAGQGATTFDPQQSSDVIRELIDCFLRDVPSQRQREAIEVCALVRNTTEGVLAAVLQGDDGAALFDWLRHLSFVEEGPYGVFPHDLARQVLMADLQWRDPPGRQERYRRAYLDLIERIKRSSGREEQRLLMEYLFLVRNRPNYDTYFDWSALDTSYAEPATPADYETIAAMVARHEGPEAEHLVRYWMRRQPQAFLVFRDIEARCFGFNMILDISRATAEDRAVDPALEPAFALIERHDPLASGDVVQYARSWMHADLYQAPGTAALNLNGMNAFVRALTRPGITWNFVAMAGLELGPMLTRINWPHAPAADFEVGGRCFRVFAHDWRIEPVAEWISARVGARPSSPMPFAAGALVSGPTPSRLGRAKFGEAVRDALRDCARADRLRGNPLLRQAGLLGALNDPTAPPPETQLQSLLRETILALKSHPRDDKLHRVLWLTYVEPLLSQEKVAERLGLPFSTYRHRLGKGIERVSEILWLRATPGG